MCRLSNNRHNPFNHGGDNIKMPTLRLLLPSVVFFVSWWSFRIYLVWFRFINVRLTFLYGLEAIFRRCFSFRVNAFWPVLLTFQHVFLSFSCFPTSHCIVRLLSYIFRVFWQFCYFCPVPEIFLYFAVPCAAFRCLALRGVYSFYPLYLIFFYVRSIFL